MNDIENLKAICALQAEALDTLTATIEALEQRLSDLEQDIAAKEMDT